MVARLVLSRFHVPLPSTVMYVLFTARTAQHLALAKKMRKNSILTNKKIKTSKLALSLDSGHAFSLKALHGLRARGCPRSFLNLTRAAYFVFFNDPQQQIRFHHHLWLQRSTVFECQQYQNLTTPRTRITLRSTWLLPSFSVRMRLCVLDFVTKAGSLSLLPPRI